MATPSSLPPLCPTRASPQAPPLAPRPTLICWRPSSSLPHWSALTSSFTHRSALPLPGAAQRRLSSRALVNLFQCAFPFFPAFSFPLSQGSSVFFHLCETLRNQSPVTSSLCAAHTPACGKRELLRCPSLLLLGCFSSGIMAPSLWKGLVGIGLFALAHAAFSAAQRKCLRDARIAPVLHSRGGVWAHPRGSVRPSVPGRVIQDLRVWGDYEKRCGAPR